jgi:hypothetical protein
MLLHRLATLAITFAVLLSVGLSAIAWRLAQEPIDLPWLTGRLVAAANANGGSTQLSVGSVALAWEGFNHGVDRPLELRVTNVVVMDQGSGRQMSIPRADVSLSLYQLLLGRVVLRTVTVDELKLTVYREADGALKLDLGNFGDTGDVDQPTGQATPLAELLASLARPAGSDRNERDAWFAQLRAVHVRDAHVAMVDRQLGVTWQAPRADINLTRLARGGVDGTAELELLLGEQHAHLALSAKLSSDARETDVRARITPVVPSVLARAAPSLAFLSALDAPVDADAAVMLDASLGLREARFSVHVGTGTAHIGASDVPFVDAALVASTNSNTLTVQALRVSLPGHQGGAPTHIDVRGTAQRDPDHMTAALTVGLDQVDFSDVHRFWPEGVGGGAREWLLENITAGTARNGHVTVGLAATSDFSSVDLTQADGTLDGDGLQVHWLRPVPPIDNGKAQLRIVNPDTLDIVVASGRQRQSLKETKASGGLQIRGGRMRITGIMQPHQVGVIDADISGSVPDAIALLREPRLGLLDRHPIDLKDPAGQASVKLAVTVPLEAKVTMNDIAIRAQAHLEGVHLGAIVAGRDLDQGVFDLDANPDGLKLNGQASVAGIPLDVGATMDFRAGPPTQAVQTVTASGQPSSGQLAAAGLNATWVLNGPTRMNATFIERRNGSSDLAVAADLTGAELTIAPLEWHKPRGTAAKASARLVLDHDRMTRIDNVQLDGEGLAVRAQGTFSDGVLTQLQVSRLVLGATVAQGSVRFPQSPGGGPIVVNCTGSTLDLAAYFVRPAQARKPEPAHPEQPPGPRWSVDAKFDRVLMAHDVVASGVTVRAQNDGRLLQQARMDGDTRAHTPFSVQITPEKGGRRVIATAADAGDVLRGLDYVRIMEGGKLSLQGRYDDTLPERPLSGTLDIENFRMHNVPALAKLLQAMTLYGLVDAMGGPGLGFTRLEAPFRLTDDALDLGEARAFSSSLGLTAQGHIDLAALKVDMQGTIVPAYFFNSLLGNVPLVGRLFSPEHGGGVFAANYTVRGALDDPTVSVNPLSALTPGFLRGLFRLF